MPFDGTNQKPGAEIIDRAREILLKHGWTQGELFSSDGRHCVMGALGAAWASCDHPNHNIHPALMAEAVARGASGPTPYNDYHAKSLADILDFLDCVKARL